MSLFVKICGVTTIEAAVACCEAGVDAVGFVFADSLRRVTIEEATEIARELPEDMTRVAVFRRPSAEEVTRVRAGLQPDLVQADHDTLAALPGTGFLPVFHEGDRAQPDVPKFLYEGRDSGSGRQVTLGRAVEMARRGDMILAGGLTPENVGSAIAAVKPFGVDVSSGVEIAPGLKSPAMIHSFVAAVRGAEERLVSA